MAAGASRKASKAKRRSKSAPRRAKNTWQGHELITKAIFEALLKQTSPDRWEIKHNIPVVGRTTTHQIDVYWRFCMAGLEHFVIVQVKKQKGRAKQGDLMLFRDVLNDIPGQPKGVFVSQTGYQRGALKVARSSGITTFELREVFYQTNPKRVTITASSIAFIRPLYDRIAMELTILKPLIDDVRFLIDRQWIEQHPEAWPLTIPPEQTYNAKFVDDCGDVRTSMQTLVQDLVREFGNGGRTQLNFEFPEPTYLTGIECVNSAGVSVGNLKILKVTATVDIVKTTTIDPRFSDSAATYLFKNAIENDLRYVLIARHGTDLTAQMSVEPTQFTVSVR